MKDKKIRVCHFPQVPCNPFIVEVEDLREAKIVKDILAEYDLFQFKNKFKPDYCNTTIIEEFDKEENKWLSWSDSDIGVEEYLEYIKDNSLIE